MTALLPDTDSTEQLRTTLLLCSRKARPILADQRPSPATIAGLIAEHDDPRQILDLVNAYLNWVPK